MPLLTMESTMPRMRVSLTLQPKLFQLFQPMGGVRARPLFSARAGSGAGRIVSTKPKSTITTRETRASEKSVGLDMCDSPFFDEGLERGGAVASPLQKRVGSPVGERCLKLRNEDSIQVGRVS